MRGTVYAPRESRRERLRRVSALPDSAIRVNWDRIVGVLIGVSALAITGALFMVMVVMLNDRL